MKERPILFSAPMVRAILDGRKTQTRRVIEPAWWRCLDPEDAEDLEEAIRQGPYQTGTRLWVRETWHTSADVLTASGPKPIIHYRADADLPVRWCPSIHMPRWASRITLEVVSVRVERLQDISEEDAWAEGFDSIDSLKREWNELYQNRHARWLDGVNVLSPWVWVVSFKRVELERRQGAA
jgi:hypothetical protein